jgi:hypothetical protein
MMDVNSVEYELGIFSASLFLIAAAQIAVNSNLQKAG